MRREAKRLEERLLIVDKRITTTNRRECVSGSSAVQVREQLDSGAAKSRPRRKANTWRTRLLEGSEKALGGMLEAVGGLCESSWKLLEAHGERGEASLGSWRLLSRELF